MPCSQRKNGRAVKALPTWGAGREGHKGPPLQVMNSLPQRKRIRLPLEAYADRGSVFYITIDAINRQHLFVRKELNNDVIGLIRMLALKHQCPVKIYCLMPSHLHLLISPGMVSVVRWIQEFKQRTQYLASKCGIPRLWQRSFFDHRVRSMETEAEFSDYIRANPLRAGLVKNPNDWPWTGSVMW